MSVSVAKCTCQTIKGPDADTCNLCISSNFVASASARVFNEIRSNCDGDHVDKIGTMYIELWNGPKITLQANSNGSTINVQRKNDGHRVSGAFTGISIVLFGSIMLF